jgi:hypothetical protein
MYKSHYKISLIEPIIQKINLIIAPIGTGKTITFTTILLYKILMLKKDAIIMTKKRNFKSNENKNS